MEPICDNCGHSRAVHTWGIRAFCEASNGQCSCPGFEVSKSTFDQSGDCPVYFQVPEHHQPRFSNGQLIRLCVVEELDEVVHESAQAMGEVLGFSVCRRHLGEIQQSLKGVYTIDDIQRMVLQGTYMGRTR